MLPSFWRSFQQGFPSRYCRRSILRKKRLEIINTKWQLDHFHADAMTLKNIHIACTNKHSLTQKSFICCFRYYFKDPSPFRNKTENAVHPYNAIQSYNSEQCWAFLKYISFSHDISVITFVEFHGELCKFDRLL